MPRLSKDQHALLTTTVDRWLRTNYRNPIDLSALAQEVGITRFLLCRLYHERSGKTIRLKQREIRINQAAKLLSSGVRKISDVARAVGYGSSSHFTKAFLEEKGALPSTWRSSPRIAPLPETAGNLPPPGLTFVRTIGEVPPELSWVSGQWEPGEIDSAPWSHAPRSRGGAGGRWKPGNAFLD
jgi:AraC-like DNA-binding protein